MTTRRFPTVRRRWIVLVVVLALVLAWILAYYESVPIVYYRVIDDHTLVVGAENSGSFWSGVTDVTETSSTIVIRVNDVRAPLPGTGSGVGEFTVTLHEPIDDRTVIDALDGIPVPRR